MIPEQRYIQIDKIYAKMLYSLSEHDRDQIIRQILWRFITDTEIDAPDDIEDALISSIHDILVLDLR